MDEHRENVISKQPVSVQLGADNLPEGLTELANLNTLHVQQRLDVVEVILGWERNNRYRITKSEDEQVLYAFEASDCGARQCLGSLRAFTIKVCDNSQQEIMTLHRPLRCSSRCFWWCCNLQIMEIHSPPGTPVASVREIWSCYLPLYEVLGVDGSVMYSLHGGCCHCRCCCNVVFHVLGSKVGDSEVATITKHWGGCKELIGAVNNYTVEYTEQLDVVNKMIILGATFLIDFNYFEKHGRCC
ncbi:phospholipid scramblase 1-like [Gigantopelta aegis]|uniref:phospholipid scramblase 1-like n=1 Tax=Gigantopelta aegis TaxID=1735272 RepID=UPI001B88D52C|nr:phospholipid scramblase 1-like [Gigantopelta aegis]